jgi:hypothetical protein
MSLPGTVRPAVRHAILLFLAVIAPLATVRGQTSGADQKPRLIVLTDISSLSGGEAEPDDGQSLIRLLLYSNNLGLEGLVATYNLRHGQRTRPELIR